MRFIFAIYSSRIYREVYLPIMDNSDYEIILNAEEYALKEDIHLRLEVIDGVWRYKKSLFYQIYSEGRKVSEEPVARNSVLQIQSKNREKLIAFVWEAQDELTAYSKYYAADKDIIVGKGEECDIVFDARGVISKQHLKIEVRNNKVWATDLSKNGSYLNNKRMEPGQKTEVGYGGIINIYGLSIMCFGSIIAVNSLDGSVSVKENRLKPMQEILFEEKTEVSGYKGGQEHMVHISPRSLPKMYDGEEVIENVPQKKEGDKKPAWMTILPSLTMVVPMLLGYSLMSSGSMSMGIVICLGSAVVGVMWGIINMRYARKTAREEEMLRLTKYEEYLVRRSDQIREKFDFNRESLLALYPDAKTCSTYTENSPEIWARRTVHSDFLFVRLGLGMQPFQVQIKVPARGFSLVDDELAERPERMAENYRYMRDVPLGVSLYEYNVIGIVSGSRPDKGANIERVMLTQIAANHSYAEVKIAVLADIRNKEDVKKQYVRWLPHVWNEDHSARYFSAGERDAEDVIYELTKILRTRAEQYSEYTSGHKRSTPHYVLFVENPAMLDSKPISKYLFENGKDLGITTVLLADSYENLPSACEFVIQCDEDFDGIYAVREGGDDRRDVAFDQLTVQEADAFARRLSYMKVNQVESSSEIPGSLTFFDMMGISRLDELEVVERWKKNRTYESMASLVGQKAGGQNCYLDINEKFHGPHGLVAGTTGSGKSETLQTYILSLAINFSPQDVGLFIIDFKGGGMANLFSDLPHTLGEISNLSGNQVRRAMVSITSEIRRRQTIFGDFGVNHIDAYTKLVKNHEATVPIPHLLIVIDEFAELKREEPEFMKKLISVAQVGRSLGVHLILATQKPSGTVDDNIWSNTKFKLCLRVADKQDSNDMLHRPDAAYLTQAGRCYLQVGNNEIFELFQSGWSGAVYEEGNDRRQKAAVLIDLQGHETDCGRKIKSERKKEATAKWMTEVVSCIYTAIDQKQYTPGAMDRDEIEAAAKLTISLLNKEELRYPENPSNLRKIESVIMQCSENGRKDVSKLAYAITEMFMLTGRKLPEPQEKTQLDAVVGYLAKVAAESGMENKQMLWMPVLPEQLSLDQLPEYRKAAFAGGSWKAHTGYSLMAYMGLVDDPENQMQYPLKVDLASKGHLIVAGNVTSGKSTFVQSLLYSLISTYTPAELNVYAIDYSSQMLMAFEDDVHFGGVVIEGEDDRVNKLFGLIGSILQMRKKQIKGGNFGQYIQLNGNVMPAIVLAIDGYANFREKTQNRFENTLIELSRTAESYGIYLVISCANVGGSTELQSKVADNMRQGICLEMTDKYAYGPILGIMHFDVLPEMNVKGRGLANVSGNVLEYQTALASKADNDYARSEWIRKQCEVMNASWTGRRAKEIPEIPAKPTWEIFEKLSEYQDHIEEGRMLPVAYYQENASVYGIDLAKVFCYLVLGRERAGKTVMMRNIACAAKAAGGKVMIMDKANQTDKKTAEMTGAAYASAPAEYKEMVKQIILMTNTRGAKRKELLTAGLDDEEIYMEMAKEFKAVYILIADMGDFLSQIYTDVPGVGKLNGPLETIFAKGRLLNVHFFAAADVSQIPSMSGRVAYLNYTKEKMGVLLGGELNKQSLFAYQNVKYNEQGKKLKMGYAYAVNMEDTSFVDQIVIPNNKGTKES